jgi:signal transduction histidine kinase
MTPRPCSFRHSPLRAFAEGLLLASLMTMATLTTMRDAPPLAVSMFFVLIAAVCCGWAGLRTQLRPGGWRSLLPYEMLLALVLTGGLYLVMMIFLTAFGAIHLLERSHAGWLGALFFLGLSAPGFLAARSISYFWRFWDRLRRTRYVWGLTHTILSVIGLLGMFAIFGGALYSTQVTSINLAEIPAESLFGRIVVWTFTLLLFTLAATFTGLVIFSLPAFLFSYGVARRITSRLEKLACATDLMREGDLATRVRVEGEDEVAALQTNFNRMAADLERSTLALQTERDKVSGLLRVQRELTAGVSHELRTPAATILAYIEILQNNLDCQSNPGMARDLEIVAHEAGRLQAILNDMLTLVQSETSRLSLNLQPVLVGPLVRRTVDTLAPLAWESKRVQVTADFEEPLQPALADAVRVEQILLNLIQNAIRHTPPGGAVIATARGEPGAIWLEVIDTGEGIPVEELGAIWEKFYRGSDAEQQGSEGVGLGLALVKELAEAMGGHVGVESSPGEGSVFRVRLPVTP